MNEIIVDLVKQGFSQREIADKLNRSQGYVKYRLSKLNIKTVRSYPHKIIDGKKICYTCGVNKSVDEFYVKNNSTDRIGGMCKSCSNEHKIAQMRGRKIEMITYKGGCCESCKIQLNDKNYCIFDFHHLNPSIKDKNFGSVRSWGWDRIKKEIDQCSLLCSNCHRLVHSLEY